MSRLHDPDTPRHKRLFDLMRQSGCAQALNAAPAKRRIMPLDERLGEQLRARAVASLRKNRLSEKP